MNKKDDLPQKGAKGIIKMKTDTEIFALCDLIRETSFALHRFLRNGHLEGKACRMVHGLLVNFGAPKLEIRKFALSSIKS